MTTDSYDVAVYVQALLGIAGIILTVCALARSFRRVGVSDTMRLKPWPPLRTEAADLLVMIVVWLAAGSVVQFFMPPGGEGLPTPAALVVDAVGKMVLIGVGLFLLYRHIRVSNPHGRVFDLQTLVRYVPVCVVLFVGLFPWVHILSMTATMEVLYLLDKPVPIQDHPFIELVRLSPRTVRIIIVINTVLLTPMFEELLFRAFLQGKLVDALDNPYAGIALAAIVFGGVHYGDVPMHVPSLMLFGAILGVVYHRTGRLEAAVCLHAVFNAAGLAMSALE